MKEEKKIEHFRQLSEKIDDLESCGRKTEARELLSTALKESKESNEAYFLFFNSEYSFYVEENLNKKLEYSRKALDLRPKDYFLIRELGISYSLLYESERSIGLFDEALRIKPDDYKSLQQKGVSLSILGKEEEAIKLYDEALRIKPDDYDSLRNKGVSLSKLGKEKEAIKLYDEALRIKPDDYKSLRQKGVSLSKLSKEEEAIKLYDEALRIKPDDYDSLRNKGVSLSILGKEEEAIKLYDEALQIKPDDYNSLRNKGVSLSNLGKEEEAIKLYDEALKYHENDPYIYALMAFSYNNINKNNEAWENIQKAYERDAQDEFIKYMYSRISRQMKETDQKKRKKIQKPSDPLADIMTFVDDLHIKMKDKVEKYLCLMKNTEDRINDFLLTKSSLKESDSIFLILRKWNSFTPIIPDSKDDRYVGGGYFFHHNGQGTVIDPGYNFIENFYNSGCKIADIDNIVMTHAHNDHTNDFESILSLIHQYNSKNGFKADDPGFKKINIFINTGCFMKFSGMLDLKGTDYINQVFTLLPSQDFNITDGMIMTALPAYHDELVSEKYSVGIKLRFSDGIKEKIIVITSDTGLFPQKKVDGKIIADHFGEEIWSLYNIPEGKINLLVAHIGSVKENELKGIPGTIEEVKEKYGQSFYPNHLGIIGTTRVISKLKPGMAVISEFGEELGEFQEDLITMIDSVVGDVLGSKKPVILPGDLSFIYNIFDETVYCIFSKCMVPYKELKYCTPDKYFYYHHTGIPEQEKFKMTNYVNSFEQQRKERKGIYFID